MVDILLALTPVLFMGPLGIALALVGGTVRQQTAGELTGALLVATIALPFLNPQWTAVSFCAICWRGDMCDWYRYAALLVPARRGFAHDADFYEFANHHHWSGRGDPL